MWSEAKVIQSPMGNGPNGESTADSIRSGVSASSPAKTFCRGLLDTPDRFLAGGSLLSSVPDHLAELLGVHGRTHRLPFHAAGERVVGGSHVTHDPE